MSRQIEFEYTDPLDLVWIHAARQAGIEVQRDPEVNASWDGCGVLRIGTPDVLDADDCLAQMILHEMCHALVAGKERFRSPDWGLEYENGGDVVYEQAALRLQAALADPFGLRRFMAATTIYREYYESLDDLPLAGDEMAATLARQGLERAQQNGWLAIIENALGATRSIAGIVAACANGSSLWGQVSAESRRHDSGKGNFVET